MSRTIKATIGTLILTLILLIWGAYLLISQGRDLERLSKSLTQAEQERIAAERRSAELLSRLPVVMDALTENDSLLSRLRSADRELNVICDPRRRDSTARENNLCELTRIVLDSNYTQFLAGYMSAVGARGTAASSSDFAEVRQKYQQLLDLVQGTHVTARWEARIHEGLAFSMYRSGAAREAQAHAERAARLDPSSAFAALTRIKILCSNGVAEAEVRRLHSQQSQLFQTMALNPPRGQARGDVERHAAYFRDDPELRQTCAYAHLPPGSDTPPVR